MRTKAPALLSGLLLLGACATTERPPPASCPPRPRPAPVPGLEHCALAPNPTDATPELVTCKCEPTEPLHPPVGYTVLTRLDLADVGTSQPSARARAHERVRAWLAGPALLDVGTPTGPWLVAPELAPGLARIDSAVRAELSEDAAFERVESRDDPDALEDSLRRAPFAASAAATAGTRAGLLVERGDLDEAVFAFEDSIACHDPDDRPGLAVAREGLERTRELRRRAPTAPIETTTMAYRDLWFGVEAPRSLPVSMRLVAHRSRGRMLHRSGCKGDSDSPDPADPVVWRTELPYARSCALDSWARFAFGLGRVFVADGHDALALDAWDGRILWLRSLCVREHIVDGRALFAGRRDCVHVALDLTSDYFEVRCGHDRVDRLDPRTGALLVDHAPPPSPRRARP